MAVEKKNWSLCSKTEGLTFAVRTVLCGQSITTLTAISVDRLLALQLRLRYRQVVTLPRVRLSVTIGSLSNDNGDGNENVISKYKFALF